MAAILLHTASLPFGAYAALVGFSYVLGSVPTAVWVSKLVFRADVRQHGSGNAGSTNVYRVFGWKAGLPVQLIDIGKGSLATALPLFFHQLSGTPQPGAIPLQLVMLACGIAAVLGHVYTLFAGFKGGKGVNTILGMMLAIAPLASAVGVAVFVILLVSFRMVSLASMLAVSSLPLYLVLRTILTGTGLDPVLFPLGLLLSGLVIYTHRGNIQRIRRGEESKVPLFGKSA